jgi:predicted DNA-binding transcriptional regulator YafY
MERMVTTNLPPRQIRLAQVLRLSLEMAATRQGLSITEIADKIGCSRRTAERMLTVLKGAVPGIEQVRGEGRSLMWRLPSARGLPIDDVSPVGLAELDAAIERLVRDGAPSERVEALRDLAMKVRAAMPTTKRTRAETDVAALMEAEGIATRPGPKAIIAPGVLAEVRKAMLACHEIDVVYARPGLEPVTRRMRPLGVLHGSWPYLVGSVVGTPGDPTLFRLDRVRAVTTRSETYEREFDLQSWAAQSFGVFREDVDEVVLRFSSDVAGDARAWNFHPTQTTQTLPDGRLMVRFVACGRREMIHHLATWGAQVEVLQPDDLRRDVASWAREIAAHHRRRPPEFSEGEARNDDRVEVPFP